LNIKTGVRKLIYEESDRKFYLGINLSKDKKLLMINSNSKETTRVGLLRLDSPSEIIRIVNTNWKIFVEHVEGYFVVWSDTDGGMI
jgi:protease II